MRLPGGGRGNTEAAAELDAPYKDMRAFRDTQHGENVEHREEQFGENMESWSKQIGAEKVFFNSLKDPSLSKQDIHEMVSEYKSARGKELGEMRQWRGA